MTGSKPSLTVGMGGVVTGVVTVISGIVDAATTEEGTDVTISGTFGVASTGSEKKWLLNHRSRHIHPLLLKVNFSRYHAPLIISFSRKTACLVFTNFVCLFGQ